MRTRYDSNETMKLIGQRSTYQMLTNTRAFAMIEDIREVHGDGQETFEIILDSVMTGVILAEEILKDSKQEKLFTGETKNET